MKKKIGIDKNDAWQFQRRSELKAKTSEAERAACHNLDRLGVRYIRQYPINTGRSVFFADIYIPSIRVVLEIDGGYHYTPDQKRRDTNRSAAIRRLGMYVCRLSNHDARDIIRIKAKITRYTKG